MEYEKKGLYNILLSNIYDKRRKEHKVFDDF